MTASSKIEQWGKNGKVIVFLHYFGGSAASWQWVAGRLSSEYRCIAINLPGFGGAPPVTEPSIDSLANYVLDTLAKLKINQYFLVGHSMGGKIALQVAAASPSSIEKLVLLAPSPPTVERMPEEEKERMLHHPDRTEAENTVKSVTIKALTKKQNSLAVETQLVVDHPTWRWWLLEGMNHSIATRTVDLPVPITVLVSRDDPAVTYEMVKNEVMPVLQKAVLVTTEGVGHLLPMEDPTWVAKQIRQAVEAK